MRRIIAALFLITLGLWPAQALADDDYSFLGQSQNNGAFSVFMGMKSLTSSWDPVQTQTDIGFKFDYKRKSWPLGIAFDLLSSNDTQMDMTTSPGVKYSGSTLERNIGARFDSKVSSNLTAIVGGGISLVRSEFKGQVGGLPVSDSDRAMGNWFEAGLCLTMDNMSLGVDIIKSSATVSMYGINAEAGGLHFGLTAGLRW